MSNVGSAQFQAWLHIQVGDLGQVVYTLGALVHL